MHVIGHNYVRMFFYCPAGAMWGYLLGDAIPRFLMNHFNFHITESIALKSLFAGSVIGMYIVFFLSYHVRNRMNKNRLTHDAKQYASKIIIEILVLSVVIGVGIICLKYGDAKYHDFLYPKE